MYLICKENNKNMNIQFPLERKIFYKLTNYTTEEDIRKDTDKIYVIT